MEKGIENKKKYANIYKCFFIIYCFFSLFCILFVIVCIDKVQQYPELEIALKKATYLDIAPLVIICILGCFANRYNWKPAVNIIVNLLFLPVALTMYYFVPVCSALYYELALKKF